MLTKAKDNVELRRLLQRADVLLPDGIGVSILCKINKKPSCGRAPGIDTAYLLMRHAAKRGLRVFLLGAKDGVAQLAKQRLSEQIPHLCICGTHHGYFDKTKDSPQNAELIRTIQSSKADILFVCFGFPIQEQWIFDNKDALPSVKIFMGLGGSLDVWSGRKRRAPIIMRSCGLEWLWRLLFLSKK